MTRRSDFLSSPSPLIVLLLLAGGAWGWLYALEIARWPLDLGWRALLAPEFWRSLCLGAPEASGDSLAGFFRTLGLWLLMVVAMMLPVAWPYWRDFAALPEPTETARWSWRKGMRLSVFVAGYLAVWAGYALLAAILQSALGETGWPATDRARAYFGAGLLIAAGLYQFSAWKDACLARCRSPMAFFLSSWRPGRQGAFVMGLIHGRDCLGCCWALMSLAFVGGIANHLWMGIAMILMRLEQSPRLGPLVVRPLGAALLIAAAGMLARDLIFGTGGLS